MLFPEEDFRFKLEVMVALYIASLLQQIYWFSIMFKLLMLTQWR
jgi:hypothetical protein